MKEDIEKACKVLESGGVILYPTDTIWGIGCDATNEEAVKRVYAIKKRMDSKALLVLTDAEVKVERLVVEVPDIAWSLIEVADKPLTIIYPKGKNLAPNLLSDDGSIGIRITNEAFSKQLCQRFRRPIVSTSANESGKPSPSCFADISQDIKAAVDYVVSFGQSDKTPKQSSSIIKVGAGGVVTIIRA